jgi:predicted RNase H-like nuclease (RuvC/YqgF family)
VRRAYDHLNGLDRESTPEKQEADLTESLKSISDEIEMLQEAVRRVESAQEASELVGKPRTVSQETINTLNAELEACEQSLKDLRGGIDEYLDSELGLRAFRDMVGHIVEELKIITEGIYFRP